MDGIENNIKKIGLLGITIPIFLELLLMTVVGNIDILMVSRYHSSGVGVLGGMSQILQTQNIIFTFISTGTGVLIAQYLGAKKKERIEDVIKVSFILNLGVGLVLGGIYFFLAETILIKIRMEREFIELGLYYFKIVGGFCLFQSISSVSNAALRGIGDTKKILYINIIVNILNVIGNGFFLFGWFGVPILGITGVGISTVVARGIGSLLSYNTMKNRFGYEKLISKIRGVPKNILSYLLKIGVPSGVEHFSWNLAQIIIIAMVNTMGEKMVIVRTYLILISSFIMIFSIALGHGTAILTGHNIGEKKIKEAYTQCIKSIKISLKGVLLILVCVYIFRDQIFRLLTTDEEVIAMGKSIIPILFFIETGRVFNIIIINSLNAAGDAKYPMGIGIIFMFGLAVPLSYILGIHYGLYLVGIWIANGIDEWVRGVIILRRWNGLKWSKNKFK